jgi:RNA polymerase sigma-70 factor (ECF subfamily)
VREAQRGDASAYERLYRESVGRVHALARRMLVDRAAAEDLTQEAFVRAWRALDTFQGQSRFATWVHRIAANLALDQLRRPQLEEPAPELDDRASRASSHGLRLDLERAIARLPRGMRAVFVLHDVEGFDHRDIAEGLGIAEGTSRAHLFQARRALREALTQESSR